MKTNCFMCWVWSLLCNQKWVCSEAIKKGRHAHSTQFIQFEGSGMAWVLRIEIRCICRMWLQQTWPSKTLHELLWVASSYPTCTATLLYQFAECDCNRRSDLCYFNQTLYNLTGSGGYCPDCRDFTAGAKCEKCKPNYFRQDTRDVCHHCNCDDTGMY